MSLAIDPTLRGLTDCGCGAGISVATPVEVTNRPGLSAIAYRVGTHPLFKRSMLSRLSGAQVPALAELTTREDDDFSIALLDAWASVADVLTFYQERIANESYFRTATERLSLLQLARLIGYELRPGVAASTSLAFTLEDAKAAGVPTQTTIDRGTKVQSIPGPGEQPQTFETIEPIVARPEWNTLLPKVNALPQPRVQPGDQRAYLKGLATGLKEGDGILFVGSDRQAHLSSERWDFRQLTKVTADPTAGWTVVEWRDGLGAPTVLPADDARVYAFRKRASLFGATAPDPQSLPDSVLSNYGLPLATEFTSRATEWPFGLSNPINLDATYPTIGPSVKAADGTRIRDSWIVLAVPTWHQLYEVTEVAESAPKKYALSAKTSQLQLDTDYLLAAKFQEPLRSVTVFAQSEELAFAERPLLTPLQGGSIALAQAATGLVKGQKIIVTGKSMDPSNPLATISETAVIEQLSADGLTLQLADGLANRYDPATVTLYANVAAATHGETKKEVLGSGDATQAFAQFVLKQPPLTYVSSTSPSGADSTLGVRVNDLLWHEVPTFYGRGPGERIFVTRTEDDGRTTVEFGDGQTGARLPTGTENVTAQYRKGIGTAGNLDSGQLSLLLTRPLGVKGVINPGPATGAADPETFSDARQNAPTTVLTLDRIVSLRDYEDFARAFSGVAKALATWTWSGQVRGVVVTVAGSGGAPLPEGAETQRNLLAAMRSAGDPYVPLRVQTFRPAYFRLAAAVKLDPDYEETKLMATIEQTLHDAFSFAARSFGQAVTLSEVLAVIQGIAGVIAVDLTRLYRTDDPTGPSLHDRLLAAAPQAGVGAFPDSASDALLPAELLLLADGPVDNLGAMR